MWNYLSGNVRLQLWKKLRGDIQSLLIQEQLAAIAKFCANIPFGTRTLDYYSPKTWLSPWEILYYGKFCTSSISLLMYDTFSMVSTEKIDLILVEDVDIYLLPIINNHFILNYELGSVNTSPDICDKFKILQTFQQDQIRIIS